MDSMSRSHMSAHAIPDVNGLPRAALIARPFTLVQTGARLCQAAFCLGSDVRVRFVIVSWAFMRSTRLVIGCRGRVQQRLPVSSMSW